jgi:hypothetical protein
LDKTVLVIQLQLVTKIAGSAHISCYDKQYLIWLLTDPGDRAVCGRSLVGIVGSNPAGGGGGDGCLSLVSVVFRQIEVSATGRSLVQRSRTECGVSECDRGTLTLSRPRPTRAVERLKNGSILKPT